MKFKDNSFENQLDFKVYAYTKLNGYRTDEANLKKDASKISKDMFQAMHKTKLKYGF